jgi:hypothetical protein
MGVRSSTRILVLAAVVVAVGAAGIAASAVLGGGGTLVAASTLLTLVGVGVLLGHGFRAAFETWPRSWVAVPAVLVAAGGLGVLDAAGAFGSTSLLGAVVGLGFVAAGVALLVRGGDDFAPQMRDGHRLRDADSRR